MSKKLVRVSFELRNEIIMNSFNSENQLFGRDGNVKFTITVIGNDVELVASVDYDKANEIPKNWHKKFVTAINKYLPYYNLIIKESYEVLVDSDNKIQIDVSTEPDENNDDVVVDDKPEDNDSLDTFDPMQYATSSMIGGDFMRFSKEYFGEDAKVKTPEIVIEEQKAEGLRDTTDDEEVMPTEDILERMKQELAKLSEEEQKAILDEFEIESLEELYNDEVIVEENDITADEEDLNSNVAEDIEEIPDLVLAETSDFMLDDWNEEDDDDDLLEM